MTTWTVTPENLGNRNHVVSRIHGHTGGQMSDPEISLRKYVSDVVYHGALDHGVYVLKSAGGTLTADGLRQYAAAYERGLEVCLQIKEDIDRTIAAALTVVEDHFIQITETHGYPPPARFMYFNEGEAPAKALTNLKEKAAQTGAWVRANHPTVHISIGAWASVVEMFNHIQAWWTECTVAEGWTPDGICFHEYNGRASQLEEHGTYETIRSTVGISPTVEFWNGEGDLTFVDSGPGGSKDELEDARGTSFLLNYFSSYLRSNTPFAVFTLKDDDNVGGNGFFDADDNPRPAYQAPQMFGKLTTKDVYQCSPDVWDDTECAVSFDGDYGYMLVSRRSMAGDDGLGQIGKWMYIKDGFNDPEPYFTSIGGQSVTFQYIAGLIGDPGNPGAIPYVPDYEGAKNHYQNVVLPDSVMPTKLVRVVLPINIEKVRLHTGLGAVSWVHFKETGNIVYLALNHDEAVLLSFRRKRGK